MLALSLTALLLVVPSDLKCPNPPAQMPGYDRGEPVLLIDGVITARVPETVDFQPGEIASVRISCWDPATNALAPVGIPLILIQTKAALDAARGPMLQLIRAQEAFRSRHERYATNLEALEEFGLDPDAALELAATETGWSASTRAGDIAYRCSANEASAGTVDEAGEPKLDCSTDDTIALRSLRARYDGKG